jgi:hypothetical protein
MSDEKSTIGRAESIALPALSLAGIPAKTDTGAYSSAIHAVDVKELILNGEKTLQFSVLENHAAYEQSSPVETKNYRAVMVHNSFGEKQRRYVVQLKVSIAGKTFVTEFTLADRSKKMFPVLLGRKLLKNRFVVDVDKSGVEYVPVSKIKEDWQDEEIGDDELTAPNEGATTV